MNTTNTHKLIKLGDTNETVANPDADIRGRNVRDKHGEDVGKVQDLLIDASERKVRFLEVASGGFLGIGKEVTFIPVDAITAITEEDVTLDQTRDYVAAAPEYDPALVQEQENYTGILGYWGFGHFWSHGYRYPDYPHYGNESADSGPDPLRPSRW